MQNKENFHAKWDNESAESNVNSGSISSQL